jgi:hypothetical protein
MDQWQLWAPVTALFVFWQWLFADAPEWAIAKAGAGFGNPFT